MVKALIRSSLLLLVFPAFLHAVVRTWVSTSGSDTNPCTRAAPCRNFDAAINAVDAGGEVVVIESGGYGPFTVTKSVSILTPPGLLGAVAPTSGAGITIDAGPADSVVLRGLSIGSFGATRGIHFLAGGSLHAYDLLVRRFNIAGLHQIAPSTLVVRDSVFLGNGSALWIDSATEGAHALLERVSFEENDLYGLELRDNGRVVAKSCSVIGGDNGLVAGPDSGGTAQLDVESCVIMNTATALKAGFGNGTATIRVSNSTITDNEFATAVTEPSVILSRGNNSADGNVSGPSFGTYSPQ